MSIKKFTVCFATLLMVIFATVVAASAQVTVTGSTGANGTYTTLGAAFTAINGAGTQAGNNILVEVSANTTETATAQLNASDWTTLTVRPSTAGVIVQGTITGAIIRLNGADNVTIDGRLNGIGTTNRDMTVQNNSTAASTAAIWLSSNGVGAGATNNVVRNLEIRCGATQNTSTNSTFGIIMSGTTISTSSNGDDNDNNQFIFNRILRVRYGITTRGVTTNLNIAPIVTDNIIGPTSFGADQIGKVGIFMQADTGAVVSRNTVQYVGGDFANTTGGADRVGIAIGQESWSMTPSTLTSNTYTVTKNIISNVVEERTFSAVGLLLGTTGGGSPTNNLVANNFIINVKANGTAGDHAVGLGISGGHTDTVINNSVSMFGDVDPNPSATATTNHSSGIRIANTNGTTHLNLTLSNNSVYMDLSSSSTAAVRFYAISGPINSYSFGTGGENYNNLYINPTNLQLLTGGLGTASGNTLTTGFATLANWQTAYTVPQDANSIQADPQYASISSDLHIAATSPNIDAGVNLPVITDDIDNQARPNGAFYDIGADEFYPAPGILQLSATAYSGSEGGTATITVDRVSGSSGLVTVDVSLADVTATGGAACGVGVDYVNPGTTTLTFPNLVTTQSFNVTLCSDAVVDPAETFTATLSNPTGGATLGTPTAATVTITDIPPPFSGVYTVGTGGTYPSLTNPGGIFEAINLAGTIGPVTIEIVSDLSGETGTHPLNEHANPITIKPAGAPRTVSGSSASAIIKLNGADNVTINGSVLGLLYEPEAEPEVLGGNSAIRELTIQNTNTGALATAIWIATNATSGATNNTIKNLNIVGPGAFSGQGIIAGSGTTLGGPAEPGRQNSFNTIRNNSAVGVQNAVFTNGDATTLDQSWLITENEFGSAVAAQKLSFRGIAVQNAQSFTISENRIFGINSSTTTTATMSGILVGGVLNGGGILRNEIRDIRQNNTVGWGSNGIFLNATNATAGVTVANNFISDVASQGFNGFDQGDNGYGIMVNSGGQYGIWNNTIVMNANQVAAGGHSSCINIEDAVAAGSLAIQNNILENRQTVGNRYGIIDQRTTPAVYSALSNNLYHNPTGAFFGRLNSINHSTLAAWQTATGLDALSLDADPLFVSATDFHLTATSPAINAGTTLALVPDDIDNHTRPQGPAYDIGADELLLTTYTVGGTVSGLVGTGLVLQNNGGDNLTITANGPFTFATALPDLSTYNVTVFTQPTGPAQVCTVTNGTGTISGANVTNVQVTCVTVQWPLTVSLAGSGSGSVSSSPAGISCPGTCSANFDDSTVVTLTPTASIGSVFAGWSGDCTGMGPCTVNMTAARNVTATFNLLPQVQFAATTFQDDESQSATITVTRSVDLTGSSSVDVTLTDNTATGGAACTPGVDYINPGTVTLNFGIGVGAQSFNVTLCGDTLTESLETVDLALSNPVNAFIVPPSTATLNVNDTANQWRNPAPITMNLGTTASLYPSTISVTGAPTSIGAIRVTLYDLYHDFPDHINVLLVGPTGAKFVLMADAGGPGPGIPSANHVTLTFTDHPAPIVPDSAPPTTGSYLPTTWEPVLPTAFPAPAPPAPYPTPGNDPFPSRDVTEAMFGQYGLTDGNGTWSLYIVDDAGTPLAPDVVMGEVLGGWGLELLAPTNTAVTVSGRVMTPDGAGLRNAVVSMTDSLGITRRVTTSSLGYYTFTDIPVGDTYVVGVSSRRYRFTTRVVPVLDPIADLDFIGQE